MSDTSSKNSLVYKVTPVRYRQEDGLSSITDLCKAEGRPAPMRPDRWIKRSKTQELLEKIASTTKAVVKRDKDKKIVYIAGVLETVKGGYLGAQGVWANREVGEAYAKSLSSECGRWFEEVFEESLFTQTLVLTSSRHCCKPIQTEDYLLEVSPTTTAKNKKRVPEIPGGIKVLGVKFQAFLDPVTSQPVFSQRGTARALQIRQSSLGNILASDDFKALRGAARPWDKLNTTVSPKPIFVITQTDLVWLVQIAAEKGYPVAISMQQAGFSVVLQQSVDEALGVERTRKEYLDAGTTLQERLQQNSPEKLQERYLYSYHEMKNTTFEKGYGVKTLCKVNKQVSNLAVPDAALRRAVSKSWRKGCTSHELVRITVGNVVHQKAVEQSMSNTLDGNLRKAAERMSDINKLIDEPY